MLQCLLRIFEAFFSYFSIKVFPFHENVVNMADFASENAMCRMDLLMTAVTHHRKFESEYEVTKNLAYYPVNVSSS